LQETDDEAQLDPEEQVIGLLKQHQAGLGTKELCRKHGISDATFYKWRSKNGGMNVSGARTLKALEDENRKPIPTTLSNGGQFPKDHFWDRIFYPLCVGLIWLGVGLSLGSRQDTVCFRHVR
jgi:putative transposase